MLTAVTYCTRSHGKKNWFYKNVVTINQFSLKMFRLLYSLAQSGRGSYSVVVSTGDSDSPNTGSNPVRTYFLFFWNIFIILFSFFLKLNFSFQFAALFINNSARSSNWNSILATSSPHSEKWTVDSDRLSWISHRLPHCVLLMNYLKWTRNKDATFF